MRSLIVVSTIILAEGGFWGGFSDGLDAGRLQYLCQHGVASACQMLGAPRTDRRLDDLEDEIRKQKRELKDLKDCQEFGLCF